VFSIAPIAFLASAATAVSSVLGIGNSVNDMVVID